MFVTGFVTGVVTDGTCGSGRGEAVVGFSVVSETLGTTGENPRGREPETEGTGAPKDGGAGSAGGCGGAPLVVCAVVFVTSCGRTITVSRLRSGPLRRSDSGITVDGAGAPLATPVTVT